MRWFTYFFAGILLTVSLFMATNKLRIQNTFRNAWERDLILISQSEKMPPVWKALYSFNISKDSHPLYLPASEQDSPFKQVVHSPTANQKPTPNENSSVFHAEILIVDATLGERVVAVVQYDIENSQKNTIFEFGRTLELGRYIGGLYWPHIFADQFR